MSSPRRPTRPAPGTSFGSPSANYGPPYVGGGSRDYYATHLTGNGNGNGNSNSNNNNNNNNMGLASGPIGTPSHGMGSGIGASNNYNSYNFSGSAGAGAGAPGSRMREQILESKLMSANEEIGTLKSDLSRLADRAREAELAAARAAETSRDDHTRRTEELRQAQQRINQLQSELMSKEEAAAALSRDLRARIRTLEREMTNLKHEYDTSQDLARNQAMILEAAHSSHREEEERLRSLYEDRIKELDASRKRAEEKAAKTDMLIKNSMHRWEQFVVSSHLFSINEDAVPLTPHLFLSDVAAREDAAGGFKGVSSRIAYLAEQSSIQVQRIERQQMDEQRFLHEVARDTLTDMHGLLQRFADLRNEHRQLFAEVQDLRPLAVQVAPLKDENSALSRELATARATLTDDLRVARMQIEDLRDKQEQLDGARELAENECVRLKELLIREQSVVKDWEQHRRLEYEHRLSDAGRKQAELSHTIASLQESLEQQQTLSKIVERERDDLRIRAESSEKLLARLSEELESERLVAQEEMGSLRRQFEDAKRDNRLLVEQLTDSQRSSEQLLEKIRVDQTRLDEAQLRLDATVNERDNVQRRTLFLQQQLEAATAAVASAAATSAKDQSLLEEQQQQQQQQQMLERMARNAKLELEAIKSELQATRSNLDIVQQHRDQLQRDNQLLKEVADTSASDPMRLRYEQEIQSLRQQLQQASAAKVAASSEDMATSNELRREMEMQQRAHERTVAELRSVNAELASQLKQTQALMTLQHPQPHMQTQPQPQTQNIPSGRRVSPANSSSNSGSGSGSSSSSGSGLRHEATVSNASQYRTEAATSSAGPGGNASPVGGSGMLTSPLPPPPPPAPSASSPPQLPATTLPIPGTSGLLLVPPPPPPPPPPGAGVGGLQRRPS